MVALCDWCQQSMNVGTGCTVDTFDDFIDGLKRKRIPYTCQNGQHCGDCNVTNGQLHHPSCDMEICPRCNGQSLSCDCVLI